MNEFKQAFDVFHKRYITKLKRKSLREHLYEIIADIVLCLFSLGSMLCAGIVDETVWSGLSLLLAVTFLCFLYLDWNTYVDRKTKCR